MAKIAQLHNGTEIHFPDDTPDQHMDTAVAQHLGVPADPSNIVPTLMAAFSQHLQQQQGDKQAQVSQLVSAVHDNRAIADSKMQQADQHTGAKVDAVNGVAQAMITGLQPLELLHNIAQGSQAIPEIVKAINNLSQTIIQATKLYVSIISAPKEFYHHPDGKPKGVRIAKTPNIGDML